MHAKFFVATLLAVAGLTSAADAAIVTVTFAGALTNPISGNETGTFTGTAVYDTASSDTTQPLQSNVTTGFSITSRVFTDLYGHPTVTQAGFPGSTGDVSYDTDASGLGVDRYELVLHVAQANASRLTLDVLFPLGTFGASYGLPASLAPLGDASVVSSRFDDNSDFTLGTITQFSLTSVASPTPEPASWALMIGGFGLIGAVLRRRPSLGVAA